MDVLYTFTVAQPTSTPAPKTCRYVSTTDPLHKETIYQVSQYSSNVQSILDISKSDTGISNSAKNEASI